MYQEQTQANKKQAVSAGVVPTNLVSNPVSQLVDNRPQSIIQKKQAEGLASKQAQGTTLQKKANHTGLPDQLKAGAENLSGLSLDDVQVYYNSDQPAQLNAYAYAQGSTIHLAPGQEKHLPHEAWHVVQQKQGRVKPAVQLKGEATINDDARLENEADVMGQQAVQLFAPADANVVQGKPASGKPVIQLKTFNERIAEIVPKGKEAKIAKKAKEVIDRSLPAILNALPFENAAAAIRFGEDIIEKFLEFNPGLFDEAEPKAVMQNHLNEVLKNLPVKAKDKQENGEDDEEDEDDEEGATEHKIEGEKDPRYIRALVSLGKKKPAQIQTETQKKIAAIKNAAPEDLVEKQSKEVRGKIVLSPDLEAQLKKGDKTGAIILELVLVLVEKKGLDEDAKVQAVRDVFQELKAESAVQRKLIKDLLQIEVIDEAVEKRLTDGVGKGLAKLPDIDRNAGYAGLGLAAAIGVRKGEHDDRLRLKMEQIGALEIEEKKEKEIEKQNPRVKYEEARKLSDVKKGKLPAKYAAIFKGLVNDPFLGDNDWSFTFIETIEAVNDKHLAGMKLMDRYDELFAARKWPPGNVNRKAYVEKLKEADLLGDIDAEELDLGKKSAKKILSEAMANGWLTKEEADIASKLLGPRAFADIVRQEMKKKKPAKLRAMVEHLARNSGPILAEQPQLTSQSLILDTNVIDVLKGSVSELSVQQQKLRANLVAYINKHSIKDIRIANINVTEMHNMAGLIGKHLVIQAGYFGSTYGQKTLPVYGLPYNSSRGSATYDKVFEELESVGAGERKGSADRSMLADIYTADRATEKNGKLAVPHFASADEGITKKLGKGMHNPAKKEGDGTGLAPGKKEDPNKKFYPGDVKGAYETIVHELQFDKSETPITASAKPAVNKDASAAWHDDARFTHIWDYRVKSPKKKDPKTGVPSVEPAKADAPDVDAPKAEENKIIEHTVKEIVAWITAEGSYVYIVGGAVRDAIRGEKIKDVDMKTNMALDSVVRLLDEKGLSYTITPEINLVKVGHETDSVDITCAKPHRFFKSSVVPATDARERDFTLNALFLSHDNRLTDPLAGADAAREGKLRFTADPGPTKDLATREKAVIAHLKKKPENFARALKFIQRSYQAFEDARVSAEKAPAKNEGKVKADTGYHLDAEILDAIRANAADILSAINVGDDAAGKKSLFIHQSGFKSPMELVKVMSRLNFPIEAIRMVIPDSLAGRFKLKQLVNAYSRNISPRLRPVGSPKEWDPQKAPQLKVDTVSGMIYQYRFYAIGHHGKIDNSISINERYKDCEKLLVDVDMTEHGVKGHPSPHYHVYKEDKSGKWSKTGQGFSRTGQPGKPNMSIIEGLYFYKGPMPWRWWNDADKSKQELPDAKFAEEIRKTVQSPDITFVYDNSQKTFVLGGELRIHISRLRDIARSGKMNDLLMLVQNLSKNGMEWDPEDNAIRTFTGSKTSQERLRFNKQLNQVEGFLTNHCKMGKVPAYLSGKKLTHSKRVRVFDLINANIPEEKCIPAASYAVKKASNAHQFVELFEFYLAATKNKVSITKINDSYKETSASIGQKGLNAFGDDHIIKPEKMGDLINADHIKKEADQLKFESEATAVYHFQKHMDMVDGKAEDLNNKERRDKLTKDYITKTRDIVKNGKMVKQSHDDVGNDKFEFNFDGCTAIVRVDKQGNANLVTSYSTSHAATIRIAVDYLEAATEKQAIKLPEKTTFKTAFGPLKKEKVLGDGNCLFHAAKAAGHLAQSAATLRASAVTELRTKHDQYAGFIVGDDTPQRRVQLASQILSQNGVWNTNAGDLAPHLLGMAIHRNIYILSSRDGSIVSTQGDPTGAALFVFYSGGHYDAAQPVVAS